MVIRTMPLSYIAQTLRQQDKDRFLLTLMSPAAHHEALWALFSFNTEIAKTREIVSETQIGLIRLQWWRDAVKEIYQGHDPREHEVVKALAQAIKQYDLPQDLFDTLIYAREFDLEGVAPVDENGLLNYCDFTTTPLHQLILKALNEEEDSEITKKISLNYALIGIMRALPFLLSSRRVFIPSNIMSTHKMTETSLLDLNQRENLPAIIKELMTLTDFTVKPKSKFLKRAQKMTQLYASQIKRAHYDIFDPKMAIPPKFMALRLLFL